MKKGLFVTATSTEVGKTVVSTLICKKLVESKNIVTYYKPVQSGSIIENNTPVSPDCRFIESVVNNKEYLKTHMTYFLNKPASPHYSAKLENVKITKNKILDDYKGLENLNDFVITEGAGGLFVPLDEDNFYMYDLPKLFNINTVLVSTAGLGAINFVSLSSYLLKNKGLNLSAIIMIYYGREPDDIELENVRILKKITGTNSIYLFPAVSNMNTEMNKAGDFFDKEKFFPPLETIIGWINE